MALGIEKQPLGTKHFVGIRRRVKADAIAQACAEILPATFQWLQAKGIQPDGPPMTIYHAHHAEEGEFDLQPGFFVTEPVEPGAPMTRRPGEPTPPPGTRGRTRPWARPGPR